MVLKKPDLSAGICLTVIAGTFGFIAYRDFPLSTEGVPGPAFFPILACFILAVLGLLLMLGSLRGKGLPEIKFKKTTGLSGGFIIIAAYILAFGCLGFTLSTVMFLVLLMVFMKIRQKLLILAVSLVATLVISILFRIYLNIPLPETSFFIKLFDH
jgi:putative tricarboxylic transport membrane protein